MEERELKMKKMKEKMESREKLKGREEKRKRMVDIKILHTVDIKIQDTKGSEKKMDKRRVCIEDGKEKMQC